MEKMQEGREKDGMLMQSQVCQEFRYEGPNEENKQKMRRFLELLRQTSFLCFSLCADKDFPLDQFFIRRLTEQACPLDLTLHSLIPPHSSVSFSLTHKYSIYTT